MRQCQRLTIWSGCPAHAKEKTGRGDSRLTIFVRGPTNVDPKVGDPRLTQRGPRVDLQPRVTAHVQEVLCSFSYSNVGAFILIIRAAIVKENLLGDHVVAVKHGGTDTGFLRHATIASKELAFSKGLLILVSKIGIGSAIWATSATAGSTRCA